MEKSTPLVDRKTDAALLALMREASAGNRGSLEEVVRSLADDVYRLALRMTGHVADAEDATQEILLKIVTHLGSFRGDAAPRTWAHRIAINHLLDRKRSRVEAANLSFEAFGTDLLDGLSEGDPGDEHLAEEVKLGCTLAMLTCLDREHRVSYVLGEVFDLPITQAAATLGVSEAAHRQRLSRARRQLESFTTTFCGVVNKDAPCRCDKRVERALELGRVHRERPVLSVHAASARPYVEDLQQLHDTAALMRSHPDYVAPESIVAAVEASLVAGSREPPDVCGST